MPVLLCQCNIINKVPVCLIFRSQLRCSFSNTNKQILAPSSVLFLYYRSFLLPDRTDESSSCWSVCISRWGTGSFVGGGWTAWLGDWGSRSPSRTPTAAHTELRPSACPPPPPAAGTCTHCSATPPTHGRLSHRHLENTKTSWRRSGIKLANHQV